MALKEYIIQIYQEHGIEKDRIYMKKYMKDRFDYFGLRSPIRREISKPILKEVKSLPKTELKELILFLWNQPQRELHYLAIDMAVNCFKKDIEVNDMAFFEKLANKNQWWDTIDFIAPKLMAWYLLKYPEKRIFYIDKWIETENIWLIRCAILFQLKYKQDVDLGLLFETILKTVGSKEFFINKAIGWVLRENTRLYPEAIIDFVRDNESLLSNLSKKEALRLLNS